MVMLVLPPSPYRNQNRILSPSALEPLALTLERTDFNLDDLRDKSSELALRYQTRKNEQWDSFQRSISTLTKNAQVYFGDFLLFLFIWIALFKLLPQTAWVHSNGGRFWPVVLVLSVLAWFAWFRVYRAVAAVPSLFLIYISMMVRVYPDMKAILEISEEKRENVRKRLEELLQDEQKYTEFRPSLLGLVLHKAGLHNEISESEVARQDRGRPFPLLYKRGRIFAWDTELYTNYDKQWLSGYMSYLYYRLHNRLSHIAAAVWQLTRYIVTGAP